MCSFDTKTRRVTSISSLFETMKGVTLSKSSFTQSAKRKKSCARFEMTAPRLTVQDQAERDLSLMVIGEELRIDSGDYG
jgi:hypothetical protein